MVGKNSNTYQLENYPLPYFYWCSRKFKNIDGKRLINASKIIRCISINNKEHISFSKGMLEVFFYFISLHLEGRNPDTYENYSTQTEDIHVVGRDFIKGSAMSTLLYSALILFYFICTRKTDKIYSTY